MNILIITLNIKGGIVHYTSQLSNALSKHSDVYVIAPYGIENEVFSKSVNLVQLHTGNILKNFIINSILINRVSLFLKTVHDINPNVIHLQACHPWICLFLPFLKKYKIITTIHDVDPHPGSSMSLIQKISKNIHIKYSNALIVHGDFAKKKLEKGLVTKNIFTIPHGDYSFFERYTLPEYKEEPGNVLFFGAIKEYKGLNYLIQAVPKISESIPNLKVVIAGAGKFKEKTYVENCSYFELHNRFIENNEVASFFQRASVVVLPYIEGTQTGIIPIAYAFKKPVIVTDVGSIPEVVDNNITGIIVPPRDSNSLANSIIKILMNNSLRKQMGENAYKKMKNELSWDPIAEKTILIYKDVLKTN